MKRLLLHSSDRDLVWRIGQAVGKRLGMPCGDWFGLSRDAIWERLREEGDGVYILRSMSLLDRERRVEALARWTVVGVKGRLGWANVEEDEGGVEIERLVDCSLSESHRIVRDGIVAEGDVVGEIVELVERRPVVVAAAERSYLVEVGRGLIEAGMERIEFGGPVMLYLTDRNVDHLHGGRLSAAMEATGLRVVKHVLVPGEERKCMATLGEIFEDALRGGIDRTCWVVAAGGGVTTDIGGLVAALWMRGLRWVAVPTTLLAMVDASVGGKTAVDFGVGKNAVGAFWQPSRVLCDVDFLATESERNYVGALSEVVKTALIGDRELFEMLERERDRVLSRDPELMAEVVHRCVKVKARIVGLDELEGGVRAVLNLGHTMGHALEALGEYRRYTHGEAVSLGLAVALRLGVMLGHTPRAVAQRVEALQVALGLPVAVASDELKAASELLGHDKKRAGSAIRFVFLKDLEGAFVARVGLEDLRELVAGLG